MVDPHPRIEFQESIAAKLVSSPIPGTNTGSVDDITSVPTDATVECGRHSSPYSVQTSTEGLVCDRGDESEVECTMAG